MVKFTIFTLLVFVTVYLEPVEIAGIKFSIIWKVFFLASLLIFAAQKLIITRLNFIAYMYSFKNLVSLGSFSSGSGHFFVFFETLAIPLMLHSFDSLYSRNKQKVKAVIEYLVKWLPVVLIIINIPFFFDLLPELAEKKLFGRLGVDIFGFVGPYQNSHSTSIISAGAGIFCLYNFFREKSIFQKRLFFLVFILSSYVVMATMVRTGLLVLVVGSITMYHSRYGFKNLYKLLILLIIASIILGLAIYNNEVLYMRFFDQSIYEDPGEVHLGTYGSGRLVFALLNVEYWVSQGFFAILFGVGIDASKDNLDYLLGMRVYSHNGFVDALTHNGIIGFALYVLFFFYYFKSVRSCSSLNSHQKQLCYAILFSYIAFVLVQGGNRFYFDILFCLAYFNLRIASN